MDLTLGTLYAEMAIDVSKLDETTQEVKNKLKTLENEVKAIMHSTGGELNDAMKERVASLETEITRYKNVLNSLNEENAKLQASMKEAGQFLTQNLTQPIMDLAVSSINAFSQFEQSMQNTFSVMGATQAEMDMLTQVAKEMGETTRFSASQAANALYSLGSAGQSATQAAASLKGVLQLAGATGSDLAFTSSTISSTLSQFNLDADKAGHIADVFAKAIGKSQANMEKLTYSMKYVGPVASGLGISLESTTAVLMQLYNTGYGGEQAGTYLRQALQKLASGTDDLKQKLAELGISYESVNPQTQSFADILNVLQESNIGVTESISIFGETSGGAMAKLIEGGGDAIRTMEGLLESSEGASAEMQNIQNASFANTSAELQSAMEAIQISIGEIIAPFIEMVAKGLTSLLQTINGLPIGIKTFSVALLAIGASLGPMILLKTMIPIIQAKMLALNATMAANPLFLAVAAIAAVGAAGYALYKQFSSSTTSWADEVKNAVKDVEDACKRAEEAGSKGKTLDELMLKYEKLRNKTELTKSEQDEYNSTLKRLCELVPNVVTSVDETGQAYIVNIEKIKFARAEQLKLEKEQLDLAIKKANMIKERDKALKAQAQNRKQALEMKKQDGKSEIDIANNTYQKLAQLHQEYNKKMAEAEKEGKNKNDVSKTFYFDHIDDLSGYLPVIGSWEGGTATALHEYSVQMQKKADDTINAFSQVHEIILEVEKRESELTQLLANKQEIEALEAKQQNLPTLADVVARIIGDANKNEQNQKKLKELGMTDDAQSSILKQKLKNLREGFQEIQKLDKSGQIKETVDFSTSNNTFIQKDLQKLQTEIKKTETQINNLENQSRQKSAVKVEQKDTSLDAMLREMDERHKKEMEVAKAYGKNTTSMESDYIQERYNKIEGKKKELFKTQLTIEKENIAKEIKVIEDKARKLEQTIKNLKDKETKETTKAELEKAQAQIKVMKETQEAIATTRAETAVLQTSTGGKEARAGITLQDELQATQTIEKELYDSLKSESAKRYEELEEKQQQFKKAVDNLSQLKEELNLVESKAQDGSEADENRILLIKQDIATAEEKVQKLSDTLDKGYISLDALNENIDKFYKKDHSGFIARFNDITKEKEKALKEIQDNVGNIFKNKDEQMKAIERVNREAKRATALIGLELTNSVLNVAQTLTNSIINAIETSEDGLQASMQVIGVLMGQVQNMLTEPITKAVFGAIMMVFTLIDTIVNYRRRKEEEARKERERKELEALKKRREEAKLLAGDSAKTFAKHLDVSMKSSKVRTTVFEKILEDMRNNIINETLNTLGEQTVWDKTKIIKRHKWVGRKDNRKRITYNQEVSTFVTLNELYERYAKLIREGNEKEAEKTKQKIEKETHNIFRQKGITPAEIDALHKYIKDWNQIILNAIKEGDFSTIGISFKEKLREAILEKLKDRIFTTKINALIDEYEKTPTKRNLHKVIEEAEKATEEFNREAERLTGVLKLANSEMDEHKKNWVEMKKSITEALSSSLGEAAYNADWKSFKNAFAQEMKKAIVSAIVANAGVQTKTDRIIKKIMRDGRITAKEMDYAINELKDVYDKVEGNLESFNKAITRLQGDGINVKKETQGNIIQKLSGADRDFFAEQFKENFKSLTEGFKSAMIDLKEIHNAQITVLQATLNVEIVNINATDNMSLKEFIGELIEQARQTA